MFFTVRYSSWASDFGGKARPCQGQGFSGMLESFRAAEKIPCCVFEDTNIRLRTDEGVTFRSRQGETPTDRPRRSGAKLGGISTRKPAGTTPLAATTTPQAATWLKNDTSTDILLFICTDKPKDVSQSAGWLRETHAPMAIGWLQPTLGSPFLRQYLRKEN